MRAGTNNTIEKFSSLLLTVPVLLTSDQTLLTNYSVDKKLWPSFMSLGNIRAEIRNRLPSHA